MPSLLRSNILLVGMRGCGKSSVGASLAKRMGCAFVDLDDESAQHSLNDSTASKASIPAIFSTLGEPVFREAEVAALTAVLESASDTHRQPLNTHLTAENLPPHAHACTPAPTAPLALRVVALGGGTPIAPGAEPLIQRSRQSGLAVVVYLHAELGTLRARINSGPSAHRPSLSGKPIADELAGLLSARSAVYERICDLTIQVERDDSPDGVAEQIERRLRESRKE